MHARVVCTWGGKRCPVFSVQECPVTLKSVSLVSVRMCSVDEEGVLGLCTPLAGGREREELLIDILLLGE